MRRNTRHLAGTRTRNRERGSVLTEMALLVPVLMLMLMGSVDFARGWVHANAAANAAHVGAQFGAQSKSYAANYAAIENVVLRDLEASQMLQMISNGDGTSSPSTAFSVDVQRYCQCDDGVEVDCDTGSCGGVIPSQIHVRVRVNSTFEPLFNYPGIPDEIEIDREASLRAR